MELVCAQTANSPHWQPVRSPAGTPSWSASKFNHCKPKQHGSAKSIIANWQRAGLHLFLRLRLVHEWQRGNWPARGWVLRPPPFLESRSSSSLAGQREPARLGGCGARDEEEKQALDWMKLVVVSLRKSSCSKPSARVTSSRWGLQAKPLR